MEQSVLKRRTTVAITIAAILALLTAVLISRPNTGGNAGIGSNPSAAMELAQKAEERNELRTELRGRAAAQRIFERTGDAESEPITYIDDKGPWDGEQVFGGMQNKANDWEPAIAADPNSGAVYALTTRYSKICNACGWSSIVMIRSNDGGHTWDNEPVYLCKACNNWEADPQIIVDDNGDVHAVMLTSGWRTVYMRSSDGGDTWTEPIDVKGPRSWSDHGFLTVSPDGNEIYIAFNKANSYVATSTDGGQTFADPVKTNPAGENLYYFHYNGSATNDGTAYIGATAVKKVPYATGKVHYYMLKTTDYGVTWEQIHIATVEQAPSCREYDATCRRDHYAGMATVAMDDDGDLVFGYAGSLRPEKGQVIFTRASSDGGDTWTDPKLQSPRKAGKRDVIASFVVITATGDGDFRLAWQDDRNGLKRWNTWYSRSTDHGMTWTDDERLSDAGSGAGYKHPGGYDADYGDYMEIDVNNVGETVAIWGEAYSYYGPGGTWINVED